MLVLFSEMRKTKCVWGWVPEYQDWKSNAHEIFNKSIKRQKIGSITWRLGKRQES